MSGYNYIKVIGGVLLVILLILIFFSKTIYRYSLPVVTATQPQNGRLNKTETATGLVDWDQTEELYARMAGTVEDVPVKEGDTVAKGQPLLSLSFDEDDARGKLKELAVSKDKLAVDIQTIDMRIAQTKRYVADLEAEAYDADTVSDFELTQLESKIAKQEDDAATLKFLYESGVSARQEYEIAEKELNNMYAQRDNLVKTLAEDKDKADEDAADKEDERRKRLADYMDDIEALEQDLKTKNLELTTLLIQEENYNEKLSKFSRHTVVYAPCDATVVSLPLNKGQQVNEGQLAASLGVVGGYQIQCDVALENNFITVGDVCSLYNTSHTLEGVVSKVTPVEGAKQVTVLVSSGELSTGETFELYFEKESASDYILVPNGAVNMDGDGYFVYRVKRREGILGKEFYTEKVRVYIGDNDDEYTVITKGITFFEPLVLYSDKPFAEGDTVILDNEVDFFAG